MTEQEMLKKRTIRLLGEIISSESAKPDGETDFALIGECEDLLCALTGADISLSEKDITARVQKITQSAGGNRKAKKRISRIIAIACASIVLCIGAGAAACMIDPKILEGIRTVLRYKVGEAVDIDGRTFVNDGEVKPYTSIDALFAENDIDILYPHTLPDGVYIEEIYVRKETLFPIDIVLSAPCGGMIRIYKNGEEGAEIQRSDTETAEVAGNGTVFYVVQTHELWTASAKDGAYTYYISCADREYLQTIIEDFRDD